MCGFNVFVATKSHLVYVNDIVTAIERAAGQKGTGIALRSHKYIITKILEGKAVIALEESCFAGFCYIETWGHGMFVANSGLIVKEEYRGKGLAAKIKMETFKLSRTKYPNSKLFGLTTGLAVMKINSLLGYRPVTFSELTNDPSFWEGCHTCAYFDILCRTRQTNCLCTAMIFDPAWNIGGKRSNGKKSHQLHVYARWFRLKYHILIGSKRRKDIWQPSRTKAA
jgi:hypothetical protein